MGDRSAKDSKWIWRRFICESNFANIFMGIFRCKDMRIKLSFQILLPRFFCTNFLMLIFGFNPSPFRSETLKKIKKSISLKSFKCEPRNVWINSNLQIFSKSKFISIKYIFFSRGEGILIWFLRAFPWKNPARIDLST